MIDAAAPFLPPAHCKCLLLEEGDRLLCFGKLEDMRSMIPARRDRARRLRKLPKPPIHHP